MSTTASYPFNPSLAADTRPRIGSSDKATAVVRDGIWSTMLFGLLTTTTMVICLGIWGYRTMLAGAVIASGTVVVESAVKKVQHQTGGTVGKILVKEGGRVEAGDVLVRLDDTMTRANAEILSQQLDRALARRSRLEAERIGLRTMRVPEMLQARLSDPEVAALVDGETVLLESRVNALSSQKDQLEARIGQLGKQLDGLRSQQSATDDSVKLLTVELKGLEALYARKLVSMERLGDLRLEAARLRGEAGRLVATIAETEGRISEIRMQVIQLDQQMRSEVNKDLRETEGEEAELVERKLVAQSELSKIDIRAPQDGYVQELAVHTQGGVVAPGETIMLIVPDADGLVVDAMVPPASIDDVHLGQAVDIRFPAFDTTTTPVCKGTVQRISADLIRDPKLQTAFYSARVSLSDEAACLSGTRKLIPGMPAEVHIQTGERTVWSYIFKPLSDQINRAFK